MSDPSIPSSSAEGETTLKLPIELLLHTFSFLDEGDHPTARSNHLPMENHERDLAQICKVSHIHWCAVFR
jgi:hypothetical protein